MSLWLQRKLTFLPAPMKSDHLPSLARQTCPARPTKDWTFHNPPVTLHQTHPDATGCFASGPKCPLRFGRQTKTTSRQPSGCHARKVSLVSNLDGTRYSELSARRAAADSHWAERSPGIHLTESRAETRLFPSEAERTTISGRFCNATLQKMYHD